MPRPRSPAYSLIRRLPASLPGLPFARPKRDGITGRDTSPLRWSAPGPTMTGEMTDHVVRDGGIRIVHALLGIGAAAVAAVAVVAATVASFELSPVGPVFMVVGAIAGGAFALRRTQEPLLRGAAIGLIVGALLAVLLWPLFSA